MLPLYFMCQSSNAPDISSTNQLWIEYVSAEKIENVINQSLLIGQSFVYGDSFQTYLVAIVVPDEEPVRAWAESNIPDSVNNLSDLCKREELRSEVMSEIERLSKLNGLHGFETIKAVYLEPNIFSVEKDLVTPTFKLKRQQLKNYYSKQIEDMYGNPQSRL
jgi:long-chain acyl-CoA synthetase